MQIFRYFGVALLAGQGIPANAAPGEYDEPRIETRSNALGEQVKVQRYYYRGGVQIDLSGLSFGQRKMLRTTYGAEADAPRRAYIECPAGPDGVIDLWACERVDQDFSDGKERALLSRLFGMFDIALPKLREITLRESVRGPRRLVQFDVSVLAGPDIADFPEAPVVDQSLIVGLNAARSRVDFPPRALRNEAFGRLVAMCQVQADLSVACVQESFEPAQNAALFAGIAPNLMLAGRVDATLASGEPSVGARFRFPVNFVISGQ